MIRNRLDDFLGGTMTAKRLSVCKLYTLGDSGKVEAAMEMSVTVDNLEDAILHHRNMAVCLFGQPPDMEYDDEDDEGDQPIRFR